MTNSGFWIEKSKTQQNPKSGAVGRAASPTRAAFFKEGIDIFLRRIEAEEMEF